MHSLFLSSIKNNKSFRCLILLVALSIPVSPVVAVNFAGWFRENVIGQQSRESKKATKEQRAKQKQEEDEAIKKTAVHLLGDYALTQEDQADFIASIVKKGDSKEDVQARIMMELKNGLHTRNTIATSHEQKELDLEWLVSKIDRTVTSLGRWGLKQTFYPTDDISQINIQQARIKALVDDPQLFARVEQLLGQIKKYEKSMITYWFDYDKAHSLYYDFGIPFDFFKPLTDKLNTFLNNNKLALEFSSGYAVWLAFKSLATHLMLTGFWQEIAESTERKFLPIPEDEKEDGFNITRGLTRGLFDLKRNHTPWQSKVTTHHRVFKEEGKNALGQTTYSYEDIKGYGKRPYDFQKAMFRGTLGDQYVALSQGAKSTIPFVDLDVPAAADAPQPVPFISKGMALVGVLAWRGISDLILLNGIRSSVEGLKTTINTTADLRERMFDVADFVKTTKEIGTVIAQHTVLSRDCMAVHMYQVFGADTATSKEFKQCLAMLKSDTFKRVSTLGAKHIAYSRGRMLLTNRLFKENKHHMIPALRAIAELDAAFSMARLYREHQNTNAPFAFVEFITADKPVIELRGAWMPFFGDKDPVQNDILLGGNNSSAHWLVTGPNGGGKSALIKNGLGQITCMAHAWGMVPAHSARMTVINGIRTSTNAKENMRAGESTFMAESRAMQRLIDYVNQEVDASGKYLVIADEPYRGTVNDETARRTGAFCEVVANKKNVACVVATHIKTLFAPGTQERFSYWHVDIAEPSVGQFVRTYKLIPGLCDWWFNDTDRRGRYVDWLKTIGTDKKH